MVPPFSHRVSRVQWYSGSSQLPFPFAYETFTLCGGPSHALLLGSSMLYAVQTPAIFLRPVWPLPRSLATTCGISVDFFSSPYLDVSVQAVPRAHLWIQCTLTGLQPAGFPHSDIHGSMPAFGSPWLFADCCVLRRLLVPRHSPCALCSLTIFSRFGFRLCVRITWFFGLFLDDNLFVVHMISHMVTLSITILPSLSLFSFQGTITDFRSQISDFRVSLLMSDVCFLLSALVGSTSSHTLPNSLCVSRRFAPQAFTWLRSGLFTLCFQKASFPNCLRIDPLVGSSGLEPPTSRLSGVRSNHLSYKPIRLMVVSTTRLFNSDDLSS